MKSWDTARNRSVLICNFFPTVYFLIIFNSKCWCYSRDGFFTVLIIGTAHYFLNSLLILCVGSAFIDKAKLCLKWQNIYRFHLGTIVYLYQIIKVFLDCKSSLQVHLINSNTYKSVMYFGPLLVLDCQRKMDSKF